MPVVERQRAVSIDDYGAGVVVDDEARHAADELQRDVVAVRAGVLAVEQDKSACVWKKEYTSVLRLL